MGLFPLFPGEGEGVDTNLHLPKKREEGEDG